MKLRSIELHRFRQFKSTTIHVGDFNLLVGPNNSGKTTILYAIRAFFGLMGGHVKFEGKPSKPTYHRRFLSTAEEIAPTPDIRELWHAQAIGKPIKIGVEFEDGMKLSVVLRHQFGQIHVSTEDLPEHLSAKQISNYIDSNVAFIPGLVGVLVNETYSTSARRSSLAAQGRYAEIFRSSLKQLKDKDEKLLNKINGPLKDLFGLEVSTVEFDEETDEFVRVKFKEGNENYDIISSGSGLQQVVQILTYLYLSHPTILLIDEPDAHLHSKLQGALGRLFRRVASDLDAQVFLSTHSLDLIDTFGAEEVIFINANKTTNAPLSKESDLIDALTESGISDVSAISRLLLSRNLVVVEDKDISILKSFDRKLGSPLFSSASRAYVQSAEGVGNFGDLAKLGQVLNLLIGRDFGLTFIRDRDGLPDFLEEPYLKTQKGAGISYLILQRHEIENYLIEPKLIADAAGKVGLKIAEVEIRKLVLEAAATLRSRAQRQCLDTAKKINRFLSTSDKLPEPILEEKVYEWFEGLPKSSVEIVVAVWPGKELLTAVLKAVGEGDEGKILTKGRLIAELRRDMIAPDMVTLLQDLGGGVGDKV